jgi:tRNA nucleotidyltransferase (CCA-adding enzyme)
MKIQEKAIDIVNTLQKRGFKAFIVGGAVRDKILGKEPKDFDICTSAKEAQIKACFPELPSIGVGESFGIVILHDKETNEDFEIATFRQDGESVDHRRPSEIKFCSNIETDLSRRDFNFNAIAWDPIKDEFIDPFDGKQDIQNKIISFVGNPEDRINEDHLRILRAFRFQAKLGFDFSENTFEALKNACKNKNILEGVSMERISSELNKILMAPHAAETLSLMAKLGLLQQIIPEIQEVIDCDHDTPFHTEEWEDWGKTVWSHTLFVVAHASEIKNELDDENRQLALMWSALLHDIAKPKCKTWKE